MANRLLRGTANGLLLLIGLLWLVPAIGLLASSFRTAAASAQGGWWEALAAPHQLTLENYRKLAENAGIVGGLLNTILITVPSSVLLVGIAALAAYAFAWLRFRRREASFVVVVGLLVVPLQVVLIPVAGLYGWLGLFGRIPGVVLFHIAFGLPFAVFLLRNFFVGIPDELLDAARMDGAGDLRVFWRVVLPLSSPAMASLFIFQFLWVWNDLLVALVFANPDSAPLTVFIRDQMRQFGTNLDVIAAGAFLQMLVPLVVFFAFQRYFVQGILAGSVK